MKNISKRGFTLIELLVVIAIIGILTGIVMANFATTKAKSRDARRVSDFAQIQLALEIFFDRCNEYPLTLVTSYTCSTNSSVKLSDYISQIPHPPAPIVTGYSEYTNGYYVDNTSAPTNYVLRTKMETNNSALSDSYIGTNTGYYLNGGGNPITITCDTASLEYCVVPK